MRKFFSTRPNPEKIKSEILTTVKDPADPQRNVVDTGLVQSLTLEGRDIICILDVAPGRGPEIEGVRTKIEQLLQKLRGIRTARVILTATRPATAASISPPRKDEQSSAPLSSQPPVDRGAAEKKEETSNVRKAPTQAPQPLLPHVRHIIAVASGKGGVGKSTIAFQLASALTAAGYKTGVMDADIYGPSLPHLTGMNGARAKIKENSSHTEPRVINPLSTPEGLRLMSLGFLTDPDKAIIWRGPMVQSAVLQLLRDVDWGPLDFLIIDLPPGTGDVQLTLTQKVPLSGAIIVSTPQDLALADARRAIAMFERTNVPVLGIIENMSYFSCPCCGQRTDIFGHGGARKEAEKRAIPFLKEIPLFPAHNLMNDANAAGPETGLKTHPSGNESDPSPRSNLSCGSAQELFKQCADALLSVLEKRG